MINKALKKRESEERSSGRKGGNYRRNSEEGAAIKRGRGVSEARRGSARNHMHARADDMLIENALGGSLHLRTRQAKRGTWAACSRGNLPNGGGRLLRSEGGCHLSSEKNGTLFFTSKGRGLRRSKRNSLRSLVEWENIFSSETEREKNGRDKTERGKGGRSKKNVTLQNTGRRGRGPEWSSGPKRVSPGEKPRNKRSWGEEISTQFLHKDVMKIV